MAEASNPLLDLPVTRGRLHALAAAGILDEAELARALSEAGYRPTRTGWSNYMYWHALILGVVLVVAGAIFFVAANWSALPGVTRMSIVGGLMVVATLVGGYLGESLAGRASSLLGGLLFGPLLAVYGQVYQTGADAWQLFAAWAVVLIAYGALTRFVGTGVLALICAHVACLAWIEQELAVHFYEGVGGQIVAGLALADALIVALAELALKGPQRVREREVLTHSAGFTGLALVLPFGLLAIIDDAPSEGRTLGLALLLAGLVAIWLVYRWRRPALGMLAAFACVVTILISSVLARILFDAMDAELFGVVVLGVAICLQVWGFTQWLLKVRREQGAGQ